MSKGNAMRIQFVIVVLLAVPPILSQAQKTSAGAEGQGIHSNPSAAEADSLVRQGQHHHAAADYDTALEKYFSALHMYELISDSAGLVNALTEIGNSYLRLRKNEEAGKVFRRALSIAELTQDSAAIQISTADVAVIHQRAGEIAQAIALYRQALVMAGRLSNLREEAVILGNIGSSYRAIEQYDSSIHYLKLALERKTRIGNGSSTAHTLNDLAETYLFRGDYNNAVHYARMAGDTAALAGAVSQLSYSLLTLSRAYEKLGDFTSAFHALTEHKQMYDSINSVQKDQVISDLQIKYETSKKEQQIAELAAENLRMEQRRRQWTFGSLGVVLVVGLIAFTLWSKRRNDRLVLARIQALEEARSRFFANISHEFRTPLTLIIGPLHKLREELAGAATQRSLQTIEQNANRLLRYIEQILDLTRLDEDRLKLKVAEVDVSSIISSLLASFRLAAEQEDVEIRYEAPPQPVMLHVDVDRFESILSNLLSNATKFSAAGDVITVALRTEDAEGIVVEVADTGEGIHPDDLPYIFDRYFYKDGMQRSGLKGVGIGLSLCKSLIELHGGSITVQSAPGHGTTFRLVFRKGRAHFEGRHDVIFTHSDHAQAPALTPYLDGDVPATHPADGQKHARILIVEDRRDMRTFIREVLESAFEVREAVHGQEGLVMAQEDIPDLVISDVMMPEMDGTELCAHLKKDVRTSHIPVILLTAKSSDVDRLKGLETQADVYLTKPFIPRELLLHIHNLLEARRKMQEHYFRASALRPDAVQVTSVDQDFLQQLNALMEKNIDDPQFGVSQLAGGLFLSRSQLHRKLKAMTGQSPTAILRSFRLQRAYDLIREDAGTVAEVAYDVGFTSPSYFIKCFQAQYGKTPGEVRSEVP